MKPVVAYQGGKARIANRIVDILLREPGEYFWDLCCGSGAISLEMVFRGVKPEKITMVDNGPWGLFWEAIGRGTFLITTLDSYIDKIPRDRRNFKDFFEELSEQPADRDTIYVFLLLQAASFGSKPIWIADNKWKNCSFRNYWEPTETSNRKYPVNPMMPMPKALRQRVEVVCEKMRGVKGKCQDILTLQPQPNTTVYVDPPYRNRTSYGYDFDLNLLKNNLNQKLFVSEGVALNPTAIKISDSNSRKKGGVCGYRKTEANEEWLNIL